MDSLELSVSRSVRGTLIDSEDWYLVGPMKWELIQGRAVHRIYVGNGKYKLLFLHRVLMGLCNDTQMSVDHINGDPLDNRKVNLRVCTHAENMRNTRMHRDNGSGYKGVSFHPQTGKWRARIMVSGHQIQLGLHSSPEEAHAAYSAAAVSYHGEFSNTGISS